MESMIWALDRMTSIAPGGPLNILPQAWFIERLKGGRNKIDLAFLPQDRGYLDEATFQAASRALKHYMAM